MKLDVMEGLDNPADTHFPEDWIGSTTRAVNKGREHLVEEGLSEVTIADKTFTLKTLCEKYPNVLAGDQINESSPRRWLLISREISIPDSENSHGRFSLDHLFLDQDGIPTLIEVKRSSDTRIRREVVGQMLDYAANAVMYWPVETIITQYEKKCENNDCSPDQTLENFLNEDLRPDEFWQKVKTNLIAGKVRMVFVADKIPSELKRIVEFLNEQMDPAEVLAIEVKQFVGEGLKTLVPRVIGLTEGALQKKSGAYSGKQWDENSFFSELTSKQNDDIAKVAKDILDWVSPKVSRIYWGQGKQTGSYIPILITPNNVKYQLFAAFTNGTIQIYFDIYSKRPEFQSEDRRVELLNRLNTIPGVSLPRDSINRYPSIQIGVLQQRENLEKFFEIFEWFINIVTSP